MARVILRDGRVAELRAPDGSARDRERLRALFRRASPDSLYFRFFHVISEVSDDELGRMIARRPGDSYALVCDAGDSFLAVGNYARSGDDVAEVAFLVDDKLQGRGIGTLLLEHLAEHAWQEGFRRFVAFVLNDNYQMLRVFRSSGFSLSQEWQEGALQLVLPLEHTDRQRSLAATREKLATAASLRPFFDPQTVAVIGASRDAERLGHIMLKHIIDDNFQGTVYPVNPQARAVASVHAYPSIKDIPEQIDLAVIVVPVRELMPVIEDSIAANVGAVMVTTSGLGESGPEGKRLEEIITAKLRHAGIRLLGPNSIGLLTTAEATQLNASFAPRLPRSGRLAVASHSGALGVGILNYADQMGLGVSSFVSLGNKSDVSGNDLLQYWEDDVNTDVIMLYLESFGNPRKFSQITRRIARRKPILVVKSDRTRHTRPDVITNHIRWDMQDAPVDALFRQSGVIRAGTLEELFDVAAVLTTQPLPRGARVGIVTNTAAGAVITEDAIDDQGLILAGPPLDLGFNALAERYAEALPTMLSRSDIDALLILFVPVGMSDTEAVLSAIQETIGAYYAEQPQPMTILANILMDDPRAARFIRAGSRSIPVYPFPERAIRALARVVRYAQYMKQPVGRLVDLPGFQIEEARAYIRGLLLGHHGSMVIEAPEMKHVFEMIGLQAKYQDVDTLVEHVAIGMASDPLFGPILGVKSGMTRIRLVPLTDQDALWLVSPGMSETSTHDQWTQCLMRLSRLVEECPEIRALEIAPVAVGEHEVRFGAGSMTLQALPV